MEKDILKNDDIKFEKNLMKNLKKRIELILKRL